MRIHRRQLLLGLATLAQAGCTSTHPALYRLQDPNVDLRAYRTFAFFPAPPAENASILHRCLLDAARKQLERRGYAFDASHPDLLVNIGAIVEERQANSSPSAEYAGGERLEREDYTQGLLAVDLVDVRRRELVWQGVAKGRIDEAMLRDLGAAAEKAVAAIFEGFPNQPHPQRAESQGV